MSGTDDALVQEALAGSQAAYETLVERYESLVFKVAWSYTRHRDSALDVAQEVFVKAYQGLRSYRGPGTFRPWLMRITNNEGHNWLRKNKRHQETLDLDSVDGPLIDPGQEDALHRSQTRDRLLRQMDALNPRQRRALTMRYFEEASIRDIAHSLDCGEATARNILFRSLRKMRSGLSPLNPSGSRHE